MCVCNVFFFSVENIPRGRYFEGWSAALLCGVCVCACVRISRGSRAFCVDCCPVLQLSRAEASVLMLVQPTLFLSACSFVPTSLPLRGPGHLGTPRGVLSASQRRRRRCDCDAELQKIVAVLAAALPGRHCGGLLLLPHRALFRRSADPTVQGARAGRCPGGAAAVVAPFGGRGPSLGSALATGTEKPADYMGNGYAVSIMCLHQDYVRARPETRDRYR